MKLESSKKASKRTEKWFQTTQNPIKWFYGQLHNGRPKGRMIDSWYTGITNSFEETETVDRRSDLRGFQELHCTGEEFRRLHKRPQHYRNISELSKIGSFGWNGAQSQHVFCHLGRWKFFRWIIHESCCEFARSTRGPAETDIVAKIEHILTERHHLDRTYTPSDCRFLSE